MTPSPKRGRRPLYTPATKGFAGNLVRLRTRAGLTQEAVAEALRLEQSAVSRWELEKTIPPLPTLLDLAVLLHVTLDELVVGTSRDYDRLTGTTATTRAAVREEAALGTATRAELERIAADLRRQLAQVSATAIKLSGRLATRAASTRRTRKNG